MLDDLKREAQAGTSEADRRRLTLYVGIAVVLGASILTGQQCAGVEERPADPVAAPAAPAPRPAPPDPDREHLARLVKESGREPHRYVPEAVAYARAFEQDGGFGGPFEAVEPAALGAGGIEAWRGRRVTLEGEVVEVASEAWPPEGGLQTERLWAVVIEGGGGRVVALKVGRGSEPDGGRPRDASPLGVVGEAVEVGRHVRVEGLVLTARTGAVGQVPLKEPTPVLYAPRYRLVLPPAERAQPLPDLGEGAFMDVRDRNLGESMRWDEAVVFELVQWARAQGLDRLRAAMAAGELPVQPWEREAFETWREEVKRVGEGERPFTESARGRVFRLSGIVGEVLHLDWEDLPRNAWDVDELDLLVLISDHYYHRALRFISPFPISAFADRGVTGRREEHLRVTGVFVKNYTYETRYAKPDDPSQPQPLTVPLFVVLDVEPYPPSEAAAAYRRFITWIAAAMVGLGLLAFLLLSRSDARQARRLEARRIELRRRARGAAGRGRPPGPAE